MERKSAESTLTHFKIIQLLKTIYIYMIWYNFLNLKIYLYIFKFLQHYIEKRYILFTLHLLNIYDKNMIFFFFQQIKFHLYKNNYSIFNIWKIRISTFTSNIHIIYKVQNKRSNVFSSRLLWSFIFFFFVQFDFISHNFIKENQYYKTQKNLYDNELWFDLSAHLLNNIGTFITYNI